ncbi:hypothetical protein KF840_01635 [bacterium]|nr:hypothetical protein [bacterium]
MKTSLLLVSLALLLTASSGIAGPLPPEACCACLESLGAQTAQLPASPVPALFCRLVTSQAEQLAFAARCDAIHGAGLCLSQTANAGLQDNLDCRALLAEEQILCPSAVPAPTASQPVLALIVAALVGVGAWATRRRRRGARA